MSELTEINDQGKNKKIKSEQYKLSKKEINSIDKLEKNINNENDEENKENLDLNSMNIIPNTEIKKNNEKKFENIKTNSVLQEKLKKIFLFREKQKFEYNKQEIPEQLKYHSDSTSSEPVEDKNKEDINKNNDNKDNENELHKISVKRQKSGVDNNIKIEEKIKEQENTVNKPKKLNTKKTKSFNQKIIDNYLNEIKKEEKKENEKEKEKEDNNKNKKNNKATALKDIIEKLKEKKSEKMKKVEKEQKKIEEKSKKITERKSMREKILKEENIIKKNENNIITKEKKKYYKKNTETKNENLLLPHKTYRDEDDEEDFKFPKMIRNPSYNKNKGAKENNIPFPLKNNGETIYNKRNRLNSINNTIQNIDLDNQNYNANKKLNNVNNTINIYKPKKPTLTKMGSRLKIKVPNLLLNKMHYQVNYSTKNIFNKMKSGKNINKNNKQNEWKIPYNKKQKINENVNYVNMNRSFCDNYNEQNNNANANDISTIEINNINNLNSSFDSLMKNNDTNNNNAICGLNLNNSFYINNSNSNTNNNNMRIFPGRITQTSYIKQQQINNSLYKNISPLQLFNRNNNKNYSSINIEDLLILEEKLYEVIKSLNNNKLMSHECFEFWNYYFNCSLYGRLEKLFTNIYESNEVRLGINYLLMSILICYDYSFSNNIINNSLSIFDYILKLNRYNLIYIFEHILSKISTDSRDNIWVFKLIDLVNSSKNEIYSNLNINNITISEFNMLNIAEKISNNTNMILQNIILLLQNYKTENNIYILSFIKNLHTKTYEDIDYLFRERILRVDNMNGSVLASMILKEKNNLFKTEPAPYLKTVNRKPYSLILDLDETLVHFKISEENKVEGVLRVRPCINEFLEKVDKYYELIIFTAATQEYADILIDAIEENKIYFEHRLYRQHTVIIGNDFIKDLSRIGRPLDKIAIVDNMPQNFRLQKENGINIKAFWGEEVYDTALADLGIILEKIALDGGDIRKGILKYKDDIVKKVTSNISKH